MSLADRPRRVDRLPALLVAIAAVALLARLLFLGDRIAHWDEGRVGYDVLRYMATGAWRYRPIVHGPFLPHVNDVLFQWLGASDFTMRLVPAVVGGLLPLSAWLYREHLRDVEVLALAGLLAVEPTLVYYSRFMRNDVLVAAFAFTALGYYVRLYDTRLVRYLFVGTVFLGLALSSKENAVLYPVCVLGGLVLLLDHRLFLAREADPHWTAVLRGHLVRSARGVWALRYALVVALLELFVVLVFFYAPREASTGGIGFWQALGHPTQIPAMLAAATYNPASCSVPNPQPYCEGAMEAAYNSWFAGTHQDHAYLPYLGHFVKVLVVASGGLVLLALVGFLSDRYRGSRPRDLVALGFYWGFVSVLGYPLVEDIKASWVVVHATVALAIPAAVGIALFVDWGREALDHDDRLSVALAALVLVLLVGQLPVMAIQTSYVAPQRQGNVMVQYAQPEGHMRPALHLVQVAARENDGVDVVWYGDHFYVANESSAYRLPADGNWYNRLPMPWYLERDHANVTSRQDAGAFADLIQSQHPPVVLVRQQDEAPIKGDLSGYKRYAYEFRQWDEVLVFYVDERYVGAG